MPLNNTHNSVIWLPLIIIVCFVCFNNYIYNYYIKPNSYSQLFLFYRIYLWMKKVCFQEFKEAMIKQLWQERLSVWLTFQTSALSKIPEFY